MQIINSLYAIGLNSDGSLNCWGYSPAEEPEIFIPDGLTVKTYPDIDSFNAALTPLMPAYLTVQAANNASNDPVVAAITAQTNTLQANTALQAKT